MLDSTPSRTMMNVKVLGDDAPTSLRMSAAISPTDSARPTPSITTRMIATAAKFRKFETNEVKR
jgi:hypothetical protein